MNSQLGRARWNPRLSPSRAVAFALGAIVASTTCSDATGPQPPTATRMDAVAPVSQQAVAGTQVPQAPAVRVLDQRNAPMAGVTVAFAVSQGDGMISSPAVTTDADGVARLGSWTLGTAAGHNAVTATLDGLQPVTFTAEGSPAPAAASIAVASAAAQQGPAAGFVADPPRVLVRDQNNNPMAGVAVAFTVTAGGGSVAPGTVNTGADGTARIDSWRLGDEPGPNSVNAIVGDLEPVSFAATGILVPSAVVALTATEQRAQVGTIVGDAPGVLVSDQFGSPLAGVSVVFAVTAGGGSVLPASVETGQDGVARVSSWTLGPPPGGGNTLSATVAGLQAVTFTADGVIPTATPASVVALSAVSQQALAGSSVPAAPKVLVLDAANGPVSGMSVTFTVTAGGGSVAPGAVSTGPDGTATVTSWTLGTLGGANTVVASVSGLERGATFEAQGVLEARSIEAASPSGLEAPIGTPVAQPPAVLVRDQNGNPLPGVIVAFTVVTGGGSASPGSVETGADGVARLSSWTLGSTPGANTLTAGAGAMPPVVFAATALAPPATPASIAPVSATAQEALAGHDVADAPGVIVRDQFNNVLHGVPVTFAVGAGGGSISPSTVVSGADGVARLASWNIGSAGGANTVTATAGDLQPVEFSATGVLHPTALDAASAVNQDAQTGTAVSQPPAVLLRDHNGNPLTNVLVAFAVAAGGGSISPSSVSTGADGIARLTTWTLGATAGLNRVTATVAALTPVTFAANGLAPPAMPASIEPVTATTQQAAAATAVPEPPGVLVRDQFGGPVSGAAVTFAVNSGGGAVSPPSVVTGEDGVARLTSWILGAAAGGNSVAAGVTGLAPVMFHATGVLTASPIQPASATSQTAPAGAAVTEPPAVRVVDQFSNPLQGVLVSFTVTGGGGAVVPASVTTDADGIARVTSWTLGTVAGSNGMQASISGQSPVSFTALGILVASSAAPASAANQNAPAGSAVTDPPAVLVRDQFSTPLAGVTVNFAVTSGGGSISQMAVATGGDGIARVSSWLLGGAPGTNTVTATPSGLPAITFNATGVLLISAMQAATATEQTASAGSGVAAPPAVRVLDQFGNPMAGVSVAFAVTAGGGLITPPNVVTGGNGIAQLTSWILGSTAGGNTVTATAGSLNPVLFSATGVLVPTSVQAATPGSQSAPAGTAASDPPGVIVRDQLGNAMQGVTVSFAVTAGGGSITPASVVTNASGIARLTTWILGASGGLNRVTASVSGLPSLMFDATGLVASSTQAASSTNQSAPAGSTVADPPAVVVRDQLGNVMPGIVVTFAVTAGDGFVTPTTLLTDGTGVARVTNWTLGNIAGTNTVTAQVSGLPVVTFNATGISVPTSLHPASATEQQAAAGSAVSVPPRVVVFDQFNNAIAGVTVGFTVLSGGGSAAPGSQVTAANGTAGVTTWVLGSTPGSNTLRASVAGLPPVTFTATGILLPSVLEPATPTIQQSPAGGQATQLPGARVRDQFNNPLPGVAVTFTVTSGGGSAAPSAVVTGSDGIARVTTWNLGSVPGNNTLVAAVSGLTPVTFTATGILTPSSVQSASATTQQAPAGSPVPDPPAVIVRDQFANVMEGVSVAFAVSAGSGSISPSAVATGPDGVARLTNWTLGTGTNTVTATVGSLSPVTFSATGTLVATSREAVTPTSQQAAISTDVTDPPGIRVRDQNNNPLPGVNVVFVVGSGGGSIAPVARITGADGIARASRWTLGQSAGTNTATATAQGLTPVTFTAIGIGPHTLAAVTAVSQDAPAGAAVAEPPGVIVRDPLNDPLPGVTVSFSVTAGGGAVTPASQVTGSDGIARVTGWVLGSTPGENTLTATVTGLPPVNFTGAGLDVPCPEENTPIALGTDVNGSLGVTGCRLTSGEFADFYTFTLATSRTLRIAQNSTAFDSYVILLKEDGTPVAENNDGSLGSLNSEISVFLPPGTYLVAATSSNAGESGPYVLRVADRTSNVTNCTTFFALPGLSTSQSLASTDCEELGFYTDYFWVYLQAGETVTVQMNSAPVDSYLTLLTPDRALIENNNKAPGVNDAEITHTAAVAGYYIIGATSAQSGETGTYTLSIH